MNKDKLRLNILKIIGVLNLIKASLGFIIMLYVIVNLSFLNIWLFIFYLFIEFTLVAELIFLYGFFNFKEWGRRGLIFVFIFEIIAAFVNIYFLYRKNIIFNIEFFRTVKWLPILVWMIYYLTKDSVKILFREHE